MDIRNLLGKRIKEVRKQNKLTQEELAEKVALDPKSISNIETGKYYPTAENLDKLLKVLNISPSDLFTFDYLAPADELVEEMVNAMKSDEDLARLMYKFYKTVK